MPDQLVPGSPMWWVSRLEKQLDTRRQQIQIFDEYYEGQHRLLFATPKYRAIFGGMFSNFSDNWCDLIVDAVEERLNVEGFRFGKDEVGSRKAWEMWQANDLDADSQIAHTEALVFGTSYVTVWADPKDSTKPCIRVESPEQVITATAADDPRVTTAAFKKWCDDDGYLNATLYLPDEIYKFRSRSKVKGDQLISEAHTNDWQPRELPTEPWPLPNPMGRVNVVPLVNRPRLLKPGFSEIARVIPLQDAVNKMAVDMLVASEFGAAPQRWATGIELPKDPETGKAVSFDYMIDRMLVTKKENAQFGQFSQTDLGVFVKAIEMFIQHIASQTRTPPHYFALNGQFPSGESIKSAETGLVAKARRKMRHFGEAWEEVISLAFQVVGDPKRAAVSDSEVIWGDPESRSESEHTDATVKKLALEVPREQLWEDVGYSPQQIDKFNELIAARQIPAQPEPTQVNASGMFATNKAIEAAQQAMGDAGVSAPTQAPA